MHSLRNGWKTAPLFKRYGTARPNGIYSENSTVCINGNIY